MKKSVGHAITYTGLGRMVEDSQSTEEQVELFFLYGKPNTALMKVDVFMLVQKVGPYCPFLLNVFANLTW